MFSRKSSTGASGGKSNYYDLVTRGEGVDGKREAKGKRKFETGGSVAIKSKRILDLRHGIR